MYKKIANYIQGSVLLQVESAYPERIVNLCSAHGIPFWDVRWESAIRFTMRTTRQGERRLRQAAVQTDASILRLEQTGAPVLALRLRRRYTLLAGAALLLALLAASNFYIWDFEVTGNETVPEEVILRALEKQGVTVGCPGLAVNQETLRNHVLLELHDVSWLAVNVKGCVAHVQVVERHRPPDIVQEKKPTNVVAARDGLVTKVEALDGRAQVMRGSTVTRGQLLISGVSGGGSYGERPVHGMGSVWARTWYESSALVPLKTELLGTGEKTVTRFALDFGKQRIKIYGKGSVTPWDCDKITTYSPWVLPGGLRLPVTLVTERWTARGAAEGLRDLQLARQEGEELLLRNLTEQLGDDGTVTDTRFAAAQRGDWLLVTMKAECLEQIGVSVPQDTP
ncbi:MAG: sporulation protein YqfD [Oscillospiraceae bacterium]|nr:sporulation protein YqfD [Oscillospiraceae bacterium]